MAGRARDPTRSEASRLRVRIMLVDWVSGKKSLKVLGEEEGPVG